MHSMNSLTDAYVAHIRDNPQAVRRGQLRATLKGLRRDTSKEGREARLLRKAAFGAFGRGLTNHFNLKRKEALQ